MLRQIEQLVQQPGCPNLYWALTALPAPCIDLRAPTKWSKTTLYTILPELRDVREKSRSEEAVEQSVGQGHAKTHCLDAE